MLKEAIEKLIEIAQPIVKEIDNRTFVFTSSGDVSEIIPDFPSPHEITLNSLDSLVKMVKTEALKLYDAPIYINVPTHETVRCFAQPNASQRYNRPFFYTAHAVDVPGWDANTVLKFEEAIIAIRTRFQDTPDSQYALKLLSDITTGSKVTYSDDGVATAVVTRTGVALQTNEAIRPIVTLKPYRTFQEIEQPASQFLIRINERGINFIEADGGMWKLKARETIREYLFDEFEAEIEAGNVVVAL